MAVALGSNLGDRERQLREAITALDSLIAGLRTSSFHETAPVDVSPQPTFLNAVAVGDTALGARDLLAALLAIEVRFGRVRPYPGAPRTLDLDLILHGDTVIDDEHVTVPHPRFRQRRFVLEPLAEIAGDWLDPVTGKSIAALLQELPG